MNLQLYILSPRALGSSKYSDVLNLSFEFWRSHWSRIYEQVGASEAFKLDDFYRQDAVSTIFQGDQIVALWMNSKFNLLLSATLKHTYFKFYDESYIRWLRDRGIADVMSIEFLTAGEEARNAKLGFSLARTMLSLNAEFVQTCEAQALIATARNDVAAAHVAYEIGFSCVRAGTLQRNFPCDLVACPVNDLKKNPDFTARRMTDLLWNNRIEDLQLSRKIKSAA